jgi:hypothetical protein
VTPEISEFSYGFALTNELVAWEPLKAAPVFPSLIEEGRSGGGYDVKLEFPSVPLYLQFKRSDCMKTRAAKEIKVDKVWSDPPFYRFKITEKHKSDQHQMLLDLDDGTNEVYYAAPRFHRLAEINSAWAANEVARRSIYVAPKSIGTLDSESHHVAFRDADAYLCSTPRKIEHLSARGLSERLIQRLDKSTTPLRDSLSTAVTSLQTAVRRAELRAQATLLDPAATRLERLKARESANFSIFEQPEAGQYALDEAIAKVPERALSEAERELRYVADTAAKYFNLQLFVVQQREG